MKVVLCAYAHVMCILIQYWILVIVHSWQIPKAVPGGPGIGLAYQDQLQLLQLQFIYFKNTAIYKFFTFTNDHYIITIQRIQN